MTRSPRFERTRAPGALLVVDSELRGPVLALTPLAPDGLERLLSGERGTESGRSSSSIIALDGRGERIHVRRVLHGGWLAGLWGGRMLGPRRSIAELETTARLYAIGAPVPRPVLVLGRRGLCLWRIALATIHEEGCLDAEAWLRSQPSARELAKTAHAAGLAVRALHDAGGRHADLHVANLLVRSGNGAPEITIIDLDRARIVPSLSPGRRATELMRLYRSLVKRDLLPAIGHRGIAAFYRAYLANDRDLRRAMSRHARRERLRLRLHSIGYPLSSGTNGSGIARW